MRYLLNNPMLTSYGDCHLLPMDDPALMARLIEGAMSPTAG